MLNGRSLESVRIFCIPPPAIVAKGLIVKMIIRSLIDVIGPGAAMFRVHRLLAGSPKLSGNVGPNRLSDAINSTA
jgi:hypothetical protein